MPKKEKKKMCPFLDEQCLETGCMIYNTLLNNCDVSVNAYNAYRLTGVLRQLLEKKKVFE